MMLEYVAGLYNKTTLFCNSLCSLQEKLFYTFDCLKFAHWQYLFFKFDLIIHFGVIFILDFIYSYIVLSICF